MIGKTKEGKAHFHLTSSSVLRQLSSILDYLPLDYPEVWKSNKIYCWSNSRQLRNERSCQNMYTKFILKLEIRWRKNCQIFASKGSKIDPSQKEYRVHKMPYFFYLKRESLQNWTQLLEVLTLRKEIWFGVIGEKSPTK